MIRAMHSPSRERAAARAAVIFAFLILVVPSLAYAAGDEAEHHAWVMLYWTIANFVLYALLLRWAYRTKILPLLEERSSRIEREIQAAGSAAQQAQQELTVIREQLVEFEREEAKILRELEDEGRRLADDVRNQARREAERLEADAHKQIESARAEALQHLRAELVRMAMEQAKTVATSAMTPDIDRKLRKEALSALAR